jgi:poly-gamma-glutamate synthesis protein (capsule biosynthesis protein)
MRFYVDMGADAIITHHSRVISGYVVYIGAPNFYGIGNLLHLSHNVKEHRGIIVKLLIDEKGVRFEIIPIMLKLSEILIDLYKGGEKESIIREISELSLIIADDKKLAEEWGKHVSSSKILYLMILAGYPRFICRIARKLNLTTWLDCYLWTRRRKYLAMKNIFTCQAHREIVNHVLDELFMEK